MTRGHMGNPHVSVGLLSVRGKFVVDDPKAVTGLYLSLGYRGGAVVYLNGKEVARAEHVCNDYGSFSGSFTAPRDRVTGRYRIYVDSGEQADTWVNVEEYKRPKFQVTLDRPQTAARLKDRVAISGTAEAYTGAAVDGARVQWRVVREVRWPEWWGWGSRRRPNTASAKYAIHRQSIIRQTGQHRAGRAIRTERTVPRVIHIWADTWHQQILQQRRTRQWHVQHVMTAEHTHLTQA